MREFTCCFTGHREILDEHLNDIYIRTQTEIVELIKIGYTNFVTGGALGFDTISAKCVLELKNQYTNIKLFLILPYADQAKAWGVKDTFEYERIKSQADKVEYSSEFYIKGCLQKRNRALVDCSSACICYYIKNSGGTDYTVNYAKKRSLKVINLYGENQLFF